VSTTLFLVFRNPGPSWVHGLPSRQQPLWDEHAVFMDRRRDENDMGMRPATLQELEAIRAALAEFRAHWESIRPIFPCSFEGTGADIDALDDLDYEGLRYPPSGQAGAALVWGNVVASQLPFNWSFDDEIGGLVLRSNKRGLSIWPFGRIYESQRSAARRSSSTNIDGSSNGSSFNPWGSSYWMRTTGPGCLPSSAAMTRVWGVSLITPYSG
jgi:hypothetical protein